MPHRFAAVAVAALLLVPACSGDDPDATTTTTVDATTTAAPDDTTTPETTAAGADTPSETAPTTVLDAFTATSVVEVNVGENPVRVVTEGTRVGDSLECTSTIDVAGMTLVNTAIVTPSEVWLDDGSGFRQADIAEVDDIISGCPVDELFWIDFDLEDLPPGITGEPEEVNGVPAQRIDFTQSIDLATAMDLAADLEGADFERMDVWLADDGRWIVKLIMDATLDPETAAQAFGGMPTESDEPATISMDIEIADVNDSSLAIDVPPGD